MGQRYDELDSLRGAASLSVVFHHVMLSFGLFYAIHWHRDSEGLLSDVLGSSPLHIFWAGHEAVILFFVLSGFVLSLPYLRGTPPKYNHFLIRRFFRIYVPYIVCIGLSGSLYLLLGGNDINTLSSWFSGMWSHDPSAYEMLSYLLMLGYDPHNMDTVVWTLVHEMRVSLIFPLLMIPVVRYKWFRALISGTAILSVIWFFLFWSSYSIDDEQMRELVLSIRSTFYYAEFFLVGALIAKQRDALIAFINQQRIILKGVIAAAFVGLYTIEWIVPDIGWMKYNDESVIIRYAARFTIDGSVAAAAVLLFMMVLGKTWLSRVMKWNVLNRLGRISYSLYLIHAVVLVSYANLTAALLPAWHLFVAVPVLSLLVAVVLNRYVEVPANRFGKKLVIWLDSYSGSVHSERRGRRQQSNVHVN